MSLFKRPAIAPLEYTRRLWMRAWIGATLFFLYAPLLVLIAFSFNDSKRNIVWRGFTFKYYGKVLENDGLMAALTCGDDGVGACEHASPVAVEAIECACGGEAFHYALVDRARTDA